ncbi:hypothetical protein KOW79_001069 [Hemibagrus wyckioides]|uniref:Uncharacterized protein n=1 Tax=Hemibagrus wyckioides TaxID=337641 RepID=A0A9D3P9A7_9TELE|nr:hypothetical protein KOW79_001069 [Hemibagrus wyckioides]
MKLFLSYLALNESVEIGTPSDLTPSSFLEKLIRSFLSCLATRIVFEARASCQTPNVHARSKPSDIPTFVRTFGPLKDLNSCSETDLTERPSGPTGSFSKARLANRRLTPLKVILTGPALHMMSY